MGLPWLEKAPDGTVVSTWASVWRAYFTRTEPKPVGVEFARSAADVPLFDKAPCGALDMWGNVRELVVAKVDEKEIAAVRGGSFASRIEERSSAAVEYRPTPRYRAADVGFRVAKSLEK